MEESKYQQAEENPLGWKRTSQNLDQESQPWAGSAETPTVPQGAAELLQSSRGPSDGDQR